MKDGLAELATRFLLDPRQSEGLRDDEDQVPDAFHDCHFSDECGSVP